jgi:capsular polysaccharide biosynthesis protein
MSYSPNNEIDLGVFLRILWKDKFLVLLISIIFVLAGYLYGFLQPQKQKTQITIKNPPIQLFERYSIVGSNTNLSAQFTSNFIVSFLSIDNLEMFADKSTEFNNFKASLKTKYTTSHDYLSIKISDKKNGIQDNDILSEFFLIFPKELDGTSFLNNYAEFIKNKTIIEFKNILELSIQSQIIDVEQALEITKIIKKEDPSAYDPSAYLVYTENKNMLFNRGSKILFQDLVNLKRLLAVLKDDQFSYNFIINKAANISNVSMPHSQYYMGGLVIGFFLSLVIVFLKSILNQK